MLKTILLVGMGGAMGSILRYLSNMFVARHFMAIFPLATLLVNVIGCLLIGLLAGLFEKYHGSRELHYLFITGFCGGFTTFSAFSIESIQLIQSHHTPMALFYIVSSVLIGLAAVAFGLYLAKLI